VVRGTSASVLECRLLTLEGGSCEMRIYQNEELALREIFSSPEGARLHASLLRERLLGRAELMAAEIESRLAS
jgi:hypothetical protein